MDVSDTGIGVDEKELGLIFDKFYRAKDPRVAKITGTGLGLALAREVARLHGGEITVQSTLNQGSTFTLTVPIAQAVALKPHGAERIGWATSSGPAPKMIQN